LGRQLATPGIWDGWRGTRILHGDMTFSEKLPRVSHELGTLVWRVISSVAQPHSRSNSEKKNFTQHWTTFVWFWHLLGLNSGPQRVHTFNLWC
jgi:hypothetical protein